MIAPALVLPLIIATTAISAGVSVMAAQQTNKQIAAGMKTARDADIARQAEMKVQRNMIEGQIEDRSAHEARNKEREAAAASGRIRAAAAMGGTSVGSGSGSHLLTQIFMDETLAKDAIDKGRFEAQRTANQNYMSGQLQSSQAYQQQAQNLSMQYQNPFLSGISGGLSGLSAGLSIMGGINSMPASTGIGIG